MLRKDTDAQIPLTPKQILFVVGLFVLGYGFIRLQDCLGIGLIAMGFAALLLGVSGRGAAALGLLKITGPVGLIIIVIGAVLLQTAGC